MASGASTTVAAVVSAPGRDSAAAPTAQTPRQAATPGQLTYGYVFNVGSKDVTIVDTEKNEVIETRPIGVSVRSLSNEQDFFDGTSIWTYDFPKNQLAVLTIDPRSWKVRQRIEVGTGPGNSVILAKDRSFAVVNVAGDDTLVRVDARTFKVADRLSVGKFPCDLDSTTDGRWAYTPERDQDTVAQIDLRTFTVVQRATFKSGTKPYMLRVSPDNSTVWVQTAVGNTNVVLDATTLAVKDEQPVGKMPVTNAWTPDGKESWIVNSEDATLTAIDSATYKPLGTIQVGQGPFVLGFRPNGKFAYVSVTGANSIAVVDVPSRTLVKTLKAGRQPQGLIVMPPFQN